MGFPCLSSSTCLMDAVASAWVDFYHAAFVSKQTLARENEEIRLSLIQKELSSCQTLLSRREAELQLRLTTLEKEAVARKRAKDLVGAKKRMVERRMVHAQLEKLQNSINTINLHRNTIEGSVLDRTILETLRASGDALRQMGASSGGIRAVEEIVANVETQMENAAEITKIISAGNVSGMVNTMAVDGIVLDDDELMKELDELTEEDAEGMQFATMPVVQRLPSSSQMIPPSHSRHKEPSAAKLQSRDQEMQEVLFAA